MEMWLPFIHAHDMLNTPATITGGELGFARLLTLARPPTSGPLILIVLSAWAKFERPSARVEPAPRHRAFVKPCFIWGSRMSRDQT